MRFGGFENRIISNLEKPVEEKPVMKEAYRKAEALFKADAIHPNDFADLYGPEVIERDNAKVTYLEGKFNPDRRSQIPAEILEAIIYEQTELSDWFGPHAHTIKMSKFDDYVNGIDLAVEFNEPGRAASHMALGIDATFGPSTIGKKFDRIKAEIDKGELATIKYFASTNDSFKGRLSLIPRIVMGTEIETVLRLAGMWTEGEKKLLGAHPVQQLLLRQAHMQLTTFRSYADRNGIDTLVRPYQTTIDVLESVMREKDLMPLGELAQDKVHTEIISHLRMFR